MSPSKSSGAMDQDEDVGAACELRGYTETWLLSRCLSVFAEVAREVAKEISGGTSKMVLCVCVNVCVHWSSLCQGSKSYLPSVYNI